MSFVSIIVGNRVIGKIKRKENNVEVLNTETEKKADVVKGYVLTFHYISTCKQNKTKGTIIFN